LPPAGDADSRIEERVSEYLNDHPLCTIGDLAKG
jgi:hypothetical protein